LKTAVGHNLRNRIRTYESKYICIKFIAQKPSSMMKKKKKGMKKNLKLNKTDFMRSKKNMVKHLPRNKNYLKIVHELKIKDKKKKTEKSRKSMSIYPNL